MTSVPDTTIVAGEWRDGGDCLTFGGDGSCNVGSIDGRLYYTKVT